MVRALGAVLLSAVLSTGLTSCSDETQITFADTALATRIGTISTQGSSRSIKLTEGQTGHWVYGPYIPLEPGIYRLVAKGSFSANAKPAAILDVVSEKGDRVWVTRPIYPSPESTKDKRIATIVFDIDKPVTDTEFRIQINDASAKGEFEGYELTRLSLK